MDRMTTTAEAAGPATTWEYIATTKPGVDVRRLRVPGGWLYQVELEDRTESTHTDQPTTFRYGWNAPVFVAAPVEIGLSLSGRHEPTPEELIARTLLSGEP